MLDQNKITDWLANENSALVEVERRRREEKTKEIIKH